MAGKTVDEAAFVEKETYGLVKWWNLELKDKTPAWAEKETLIPAAQIERVASRWPRPRRRPRCGWARAWR